MHAAIDMYQHLVKSYTSVGLLYISALRLKPGANVLAKRFSGKNDTEENREEI
jgi:hypothetical protein